MTFDQIWDLIKARPQRPDYFMDVVPEGADLDLGEAMEDFSMPEVDMKDIGDVGDECCADLRNGLANLQTWSLNHYKGLSGQMNEAVSGSIDTDLGIEGASCEQLVEALGDAISYGEYAFEQGGNTVAYWRDYGFESEQHAMAEHRELHDDEDGRHEMEYLNRLRQLKLEYEACKMGGFDDVEENEATGFYASADPFERTWDLVLKSFILDPDLRDAAKYDPYTYQLPTVSPGGLPRPEIVNYGKTNSVGDEYYTYYNLAHPFFRNKDWTARDEGSVEMTEDEMIQRIIDTIVHEEGHAAIDPPLRREAWEDWQNSEDEDARHGWFHPSKNTHEAGAMLIEGIPFEEQRDVLRRRGYL